ncbi:MAG: dienelactone hydrolase family protein [Pseudomonadota bacterium]
MRPLLLLVIGLALSAQAPAPDRTQGIEQEYQGYLPEMVFFPGATPPPPSAFKKKIAEKKGLKLPDPEPTRVLGRLFRPEGEGPFPGVVLLHGASGIFEWNDLWAKRLRDWGYVVLDVDSLSPRGLYGHNTGNAGETKTGIKRRHVDAYPRMLDALGARAFLATQPFVQPEKIAVLGMSQGGTAALYALAPDFRPPDSEGFAAGIALYPSCQEIAAYDAPLLVLIGEADELAPATFCRRHLAKAAGGRELLLQVYPGVHHLFDIEGFDKDGPGRTLRYDSAAAGDTTSRVKTFLERYL